MPQVRHGRPAAPGQARPGREPAPLFRSAPVSPIPQPHFLNSVAVARTALEPRGLLALLQGLERQAGREPGPRWGPRPLDLDLLLHGERRVAEPDLVVPHPRLAERGFVLAPLAALLPELAIPGETRTAAELLAALPADPSLVRVAWS